jgi:hypothetical protein
MLRKLGIIAVLSLIVTAIAVVPAFAVAPTSTTTTGGLHYCNDVANNPNLTIGDTNLTVTGTVCGAGRTATATLTADVSATAGCITPSGSNQPRGLQRVETTTIASEEFPTRQGRGSFTLVTDPITVEDFDFACPSANMSEVLVSGPTFSNITLFIESQTGTITSTF